MFAARAWLTASSPESCSLAVGHLWKSAANESSSREKRKSFPGENPEMKSQQGRILPTAPRYASWEYATHVGTVGIRYRLWHYDALGVGVGGGGLPSFISGKFFGDGRETNLAMDILQDVNTLLKTALD